MFSIILTGEQLDELVGLLDLELRRAGLSSLQKVVNLYNALSTRYPVEDSEESEVENTQTDISGKTGL